MIIASFITGMGFLRPALNRVFNAAVLVVVFILPFAVFAGQDSILHCSEFRSVLNFIEREHIRFQYMPKAQKQSLLLNAYEEMGESLKALGYPVLAAQFEKNLSKKRHPALLRKNILNFSTLCGQLKNTLFRGAFLKSYARQLDPYSDFYLKEELELKSSVFSGEFVGVGIATLPEDGTLRITDVIEKGPSDKKLLKGDRIHKIDGYPISGLNEMEVRLRIRGKLGTKVRFDGLRSGKAFNVTITRGKVKQKSVKHSWDDDKFLTIKVMRFYRDTALQVEALLKAYKSVAKGIILDLRDNPGGLLQAARDLVDVFVSHGVVVYLKGKDTEDQVWALREGGYTKLPIVVLVNENTASAAEIVAGALQDYGRALLVGQDTYGKDSVQNIYETQMALGTSYKGGLKLTTLWYYLPSGRSVRTLKPDVITPSLEEESIERPKMPYRGPIKIAVGFKNLTGKKNMKALKKAGHIVKSAGSSEEIGKALLEEMFAFSGRQIR